MSNFLVDWKQNFLRWAGIEENKMDENQKKLCLMVDAHRNARDKGDANACEHICQELRDAELADLLRQNMYISAMVAIVADFGRWKGIAGQ